MFSGQLGFRNSAIFELIANLSCSARIFSKVAPRNFVSNVVGELSDEHDAVSAFFAGRPAGTVSGAPKVRAMEIIDELEKSYSHNSKIKIMKSFDTLPLWVFLA